ncbi:MAG: hypothetical protein L6R41_005280 [Letrouitia leprolyta]|nr:MAG: hypothetical protein L6R41_005280 [Letrouitia leprolyta]
MPYFLLFLAFLSLTESIPTILNITKDVSHTQLLPAPAHQTLPNPYPVRDSRILLDFYHETVGPPLAKGIVTSLLDKAQTDIIHRIIEHGNKNIPPGTTNSFTSQNEVFVYEAARQAERAMKYSDILAVIRGWRLKDRFDQSKNRLATVLFKEGDGRVVEIGEAGVLEKVAGVVGDT